MRLLLIRHGESTGNAENRIQGRLDYPLSELGRRAGERLAERLGTMSVGALYTSPLRRARQTADIVAERLGLAPVERPALMEHDAGELSGLAFDEIRERYPDFIRARLEGRRDADIPGYEADGDFTQRVMDGLEAIVEGHPEQTVAVVTHGGVIAAFCRHTLDMPVVWPAPFLVSNAGITAFEMRDGDSDSRRRPRQQLVFLNDTCHLDGM